jgi:uncharacterized membrane protein YgcG
LTNAADSSSQPRLRLWALRSWLDSCSGIGHVVVRIPRQGYDLQLTRYDEKGWRATFYTTGMEHSSTSATGTGWSGKRSERGGGYDSSARRSSFQSA